jgi:glutamate-ammonia-ligase adenylyltransferase
MAEALAEEPGETIEARLRSFRNGEFLRIELRDILGLTNSAEETWEELTALADACLSEAVQHVISTSLQGKTFSKKFCVVGLGKYGGRELSYGSDLDVIFVGGSTELASRIISIMSQEHQEGIVFKMDARLRPDGEDGPLILPLEAYARYYETRAQFWEKQSLTRARIVAGDTKYGDTFLKLVDKTIYRRPPTAAELKEMAAMRGRIEKERGDPEDPERDFKTGKGGLVDVEFLVQEKQLLHGPKHPTLRRASTLEMLAAMSQIEGWPATDILSLVEDYLWLRKLESALRRFHNSPTSQLPASREEWEALAKQLGLKDAEKLQTELGIRRTRIRKTVKQFWQPKE